VSVFDHGLLYGDGAFEGIRAYGGRVLKLRTHLRRLIESAQSIHLELAYSIDQLDAAVRQTLQANGLSDAYVRLCTTRGIGTLGLNPYLCRGATTFIITDTIQLYPRQMYEHGLEIITAATVRNHAAALSPRIKSMNYLNNILAKIEAIQSGCIEALMLNPQGYVAECTGDNVFIVRHGELLTPPLHAGILEGVTRNIVMDLARADGVAVGEMDLTRHDMYTAEECFLTGTAAEVIPVTKIDARPVGAGKPGPLTRRLMDAYASHVRDQAPED
jgi:branched-chain amino acid aminotransferase